MSDLTIRTNKVPRDTLTWFDLTEKEQAEFEYLDTDVRRAEAIFVRYRGATYDLGDFMTLNVTPEQSPLRDWQGYSGDSFFSGVVMRYTRDFERVVMGTYFS